MIRAAGDFFGGFPIFYGNFTTFYANTLAFFRCWGIIKESRKRFRVDLSKDPKRYDRIESG